MYKNPYEIRFCNLISVSLDMFMVQQTASRVPSCMILQRERYTLKMIIYQSQVTLSMFFYIYILPYGSMFINIENTMVKET